MSEFLPAFLPALLRFLGLALLTPLLIAQASPPETLGEAPVLQRPQERFLPTINWARAQAWPEGKMPAAASGLAVNAFAHGLKHPRWVYVVPNGDVLVAEAATEPDNSWNPRAMAQTAVQRRAGAVVENANRISRLRDTDGDGIADQRSVLLDGLRQPFGMVLIGDQLYVANTDSVVRYPYREGDTRIATSATKLVDLPVGHHWTRNLLASADGRKLFITVGSGSNIGEKGLDIEKDRAAILGTRYRVGQDARIRVGAAQRQRDGDRTRNRCAVVNERDEIGDDVPPDYLTSVKDGGFYGWPYSYWGQHVDQRVKPQRPDLVAKAVVPDYALGAHTASLGLAWYDADALPQEFRHGMMIGQHGSWNRKDLAGYKVIFVPFSGGKPNGQPRDVLTGFLSADNNVAYGRPVGVAVHRDGSLLVADDVGNTIWRVTGKDGAAANVPGGATSGAGSK